MRLKLLAALAFCAAANAQPYPAKPVTFIVPFPPGGGTDISARTVAAKLGSMWDKPVVVENRAGAAGIYGADDAAQTRPDRGHNLNVHHRLNPDDPALLPEGAFDPVEGDAARHLALEQPLRLPAN